MPRQQFESVIAQAARKQLKIVNASQALNLAVNGTQTIDVYAAPNKIAKIVNLFMRWNYTQGTSGSYDVLVELDDVGSGISPNFISKNTPYSNTMTFDRNVFFAPSTGAIPATDTDIISAMQQIRFDSQKALRITIINKTNAVMAGSFELYVAYEEEEVRL